MCVAELVVDRREQDFDRSLRSDSAIDNAGEEGRDDDAVQAVYGEGEQGEGGEGRGGEGGGGAGGGGVDGGEGDGGPSSFDNFEGHSKATMLLIFNNAAQGILFSFFFKYADTILKKYSSTVATIFTGIASAALFGHSDYKLYVRNYSCFHLNAPGLPCVSFSPPLQFFSPLSKVKDEQQNGVVELKDVQDNHSHIRHQASQESSIFTRLAQHFPFIFNLLRKQPSQYDDTQENYLPENLSVSLR
ncbi:hypothetical protein ACSBR2_035453 [Camellia fascicularis]